MRKITLFNMEFTSETSMDAVAEAVFHLHRSDKFPVVATVNVDQLVKFDQYGHIRQFIEKAALILPDGQPIVWASRLMGRPLAARLSGSDLFPVFWEKAKQRNSNVLCITPSQEAADLLVQDYTKCHCYTPPFFNEQDEDALYRVTEKIGELIKAHNIQFVIVGISLPKRELLTMKIVAHSKEDMPVFLLFGAAFEFYLGIKRRAPKIFQRMGLEWFYRFCQEPTRLFRRYFIDGWGFAGILVREWKQRQYDI